MIKLIDILNEEITVSKPVEDSFLTKSLNALSSFIKGKELTDFLNKIKTVAKFNDFTLKFLKGTEGANQFIIDIFNGEEKVGKFVAFVYKDKNTNKYSLQIQKVEIYPEYKGKSIMRTFYQDFNKWLKDNFDNFDKFTSDFIFLYNKETGKYDGFSMWEDLVKKGLATRLGPEEDYIPPSIPPKNNMWKIKSGYKLNEKIDEYDVVNKQNLNELRQGFLDYLKQQLPNTPDYVIQDWIYKMLKQSDNVNTAENIQDWIDSHLKNLKWEYKTNFPMTIDIFNDRTQQELKSRIEGEVRQDVNKDAERHKTQQKLLKSQGISKEPIILMKTKDGKYALGEGWHRTTQSFKMYPEGFTQPSVYIGIGWVDDNKDEVDEYDVENEQDLKEFIVFIKEYKQILSEGCDCLTEAEYRGRKVTLGKPMQGDIKKFKVFVKNNKGKVVKVNFGFGGKSAKGKRMVIKAKNPKRRAAYRARHNCDNPGPRWKANYWSCKKW